MHKAGGDGGVSVWVGGGRGGIRRCSKSPIVAVISLLKGTEYMKYTVILR